MKKIVLIQVFLAIFCVSALSVPAAAVEDFTFIQCSDSHLPRGQSEGVFEQIKKINDPVYFEKLNLTVPAPSFVINSGDLNEFSGGDFDYNGNWFDNYISHWADSKVPVYNVSGNHDNTWLSSRPRLREVNGQPWYAFDKGGVHFIMLDSASVQDPLPSFGREQYNWLAEHLQSIEKTTPIIVTFHHPPWTSEFTSPYVTNRMMDLLRPYNLTAILYGHGHSPVYKKWNSVDTIQGGTTFGKNVGYMIHSFKDNVYRAVYQRLDDSKEQMVLLEKKLYLATKYPEIRLESPAVNENVTGNTLKVRAFVDMKPEDVKSVKIRIDGMDYFVSKNGAIAFEQPIELGNALLPGAHYMDVVFVDSNDIEYLKTSQFNYEPGKGAKALWRKQFGGAIQCRPVVVGGVLYVGANDGVLYALDAKTGKTKWTFKTGGEIQSDPLVFGGRIVFGSADGGLYGLDMVGSKVWKVRIGLGVYAPPVTDGDFVYVGGGDNRFYKIRLRDGSPVWTNSSAGYSIESEAALTKDTAVFGSWDGKLYALYKDNGIVKWSAWGAKASDGKAARYYAPADAAPVVIGDYVYAPDRGKLVGKYKISDGAMTNVWKGDDFGGYAAITRVPGEDALYARCWGGKLARLNTDGMAIWATETGVDRTPQEPTASDKMVYVATKTGVVSAVDAATGKIAWKYSASPGLYVASPLGCDSGIVYAGNHDGVLTAIVPEDFSSF